MYFCGITAGRHLASHVFIKHMLVTARWRFRFRARDNPTQSNIILSLAISSSTVCLKKKKSENVVTFNSSSLLIFRLYHHFDATEQPDVGAPEESIA